MKDYTLARLIEQRDNLLKELERVNGAIDARVAQLLDTPEMDSREVLTESNFRAFAQSVGTPVNTTGRSWNLLRFHVAEFLGDIHPELDIRHGDAEKISRTRLIAAESHLRIGMVGGYGESQQRLIVNWIAFLKRGGTTAPTPATIESFEQFAARNDSTKTATSLASRLLGSREMYIFLRRHGANITILDGEMTLESLIIAKPHLTEGCIPGFGERLARLTVSWIEELERS